jgi:uncharacterized protein YjiS (DUF1127 family)
MTKFLNQMNHAISARSSYRRTVAELRRMPLDVALDLDIDRAKATRIAHRAVYGV